MISLWKSFLFDVWGKFRFRLVLLVGLMMVNSLMEGMALALLIPLLNLAGIEHASYLVSERLFRSGDSAHLDDSPPGHTRHFFSSGWGVSGPKLVGLKAPIWLYGPLEGDAV
jgi:hypothetical protein